MSNDVYPKEIARFNPINARLGIKSSFKNAKRNIGLLILLWMANDELSRYSFFESQNNTIVLKEEYLRNLFDYITPNLNNTVSYADFAEYINKLELMTSQSEPIQTAFQLVWRLAAINFEDSTFSDGKERTGSKRYPKIITYTSNLDLIKNSFIGQEDLLRSVLVKWVLSKSNILSSSSLSDDQVEQGEKKILKILSLLSDQTAFKIVKKDDEIVFRKSGIYQAIVENGEASLVNISGDKEVKGPLRIMAAAIKNDVEPFLEDTNNPIGHVKLKDTSIKNIKNYTERVEMNLRLLNVDLDSVLEKRKPEKSEKRQSSSINIGKNIIYYGAPGTGKSYGLTELIKENGIDDYDPRSGNEFVERITLHPEYTYSDFVGQIMPVVRPVQNASNEKSITYDFQPGDFTRILRIAFENKDHPVFLVMEEMSRANVAAVLGDLFQLLDRNKYGYSEYAINNPLIAKYVFADEHRTNIYLPSNLMIIGTVNTSDHNVYTMDTAFKRRFEWRYVSTIPRESFTNNPEISFVDKDGNELQILWADFLETLNSYIVNTLKLSEDKQIGPYFVKFPTSDVLSSEELLNYNNGLIRNKLLQYLWEDVATVSSMTSGQNLFSETIRSFSSLYSKYENKETIFSNSFLNSLQFKVKDVNDNNDGA
ncbi:McrB family protein [Levilactobacillus brevis]|uniref:McrB family protein n=1 Tax=Levilactobacillus brevis TaxID=1580 RepID=UPI000B3E5E64|nr:AAA family ATPase [Levilactobacillus brevis]ARW51210.1 Type-2 restriction enzyme BsuMI component YdiS [Levilactobacillus brevis]